MLRLLPYGVMALLMPGLAALGIWLGGPWTFLAYVWGFWIGMAIDAFLPRLAGPVLAGGRRSDLAAGLTWLVLPAQAALLGYALWLAAGPGFGPWWAWLGAIMSVGSATGGIGINTAHELIHRRRAAERGIGVALLVMVSYPHFRIEHVHGHHRRVGTPDDPATSRRGETLYAFWWRSVSGGLTSAWRLETERLARRHWAVWGPRNRMLHYAGLVAVLYAGVGVAFGWAGIGLLAGQGLFAVLLLETVNYIEHYGLVRATGPAGRVERVTDRHSWNAGHRFTNLTLFNLGLHADHHESPGKPYYALANHDGAPQLPGGYPAMMLLAMLPPLWFRTMDPRIASGRPGVDGGSVTVA